MRLLKIIYKNITNYELFLTIYKDEPFETSKLGKGDEMIYEMKHLLKNVLIHFLKEIKLGWKYQWKVVVLSLIVLIYCITNVVK